MFQQSNGSLVTLREITNHFLFSVVSLAILHRGEKITQLARTSSTNEYKVFTLYAEAYTCMRTQMIELKHEPKSLSSTSKTNEHCFNLVLHWPTDFNKLTKSTKIVYSFSAVVRRAYTAVDHVSIYKLPFFLEIGGYRLYNRHPTQQKIRMTKYHLALSPSATVRACLGFGYGTSFLS
jgi:hypothetical protein